MGSETDLRFTYLYAWKRLVQARAVGGIMSAISALNGIPSACNRAMLSETLRTEWNYDSFVMSDCDTISAISKSFRYTATVEEAVAVALRAGGDLSCGPEYILVENATDDGLAGHNDIDRAVRRLLHARGRMGGFDPDAFDPYKSIPFSVVNSQAHQSLARQVVAESVVLLKNEQHTLPLQLPQIQRLAIIGPSADDSSVQAHTYHGTPSRWNTIASAFRTAAEVTGTAVTVVKGCERRGTDTSGFADAIAAARWSDAIVFVGGLSPSDEEEDTDRLDLHLPGKQLELISAIFGNTSSEVPIVVVLVTGGPVSEPSFMGTLFKRGASVWVSYFGQDGAGIVDVLAKALLRVGFPGRFPWTRLSSHHWKTTV